MGQQVDGGHQHAGGADAALCGGMAGKTGAEAGELCGLRLDRFHHSARDTGGGDQAGALGFAVHQNGAGPAIACIAADLGALEP